MGERRDYNRAEAGRRIRRMRELYGMSRQQAAEAAGCTEKHYADIERGYVGMSLGTLLSLARIFSVWVDFLLLGVAEEGGKPGQEGESREEERVMLGMLDALPAEKRRFVLEWIRMLFSKA